MRPVKGSGGFPRASSSSITRLSASYALSASNAFASIPGSIASARAKSWTCPAVRTIFNGRPRASTNAWILVLRRPLLRPIARSSPTFFWCRQVAPGNTGRVAMDHSIHETPVVGRWDVNRTGSPRQAIADPVPLVVTQDVGAHRSAFGCADTP